MEDKCNELKKNITIPEQYKIPNISNISNIPDMNDVKNHMESLNIPKTNINLPNMFLTSENKIDWEEYKKFFENLRQTQNSEFAKLKTKREEIFKQKFQL